MAFAAQACRGKYTGLRPAAGLLFEVGQLAIAVPGLVFLSGLLSQPLIRTTAAISAKPPMMWRKLAIRFSRELVVILLLSRCATLFSRIRPVQPLKLTCVNKRSGGKRAKKRGPKAPFSLVHDSVLATSTQQQSCQR